MIKAFIIAASFLTITGTMSSAKEPPIERARETVVLLHGLGRGPWGMKVLEWRLAGAGYEVHNIGYPTDANTLEAAADIVHGRYLACCEAAPTVNFVTHSLGGLVLRMLSSRHQLPNAGRAVMLAPPNRGSEIVDQLGNWDAFALALGPIAPQLGTGPEDLPARLPPPSMPFGVIAGSTWINPLGPLLLPSPHDGTVSVASTRLDGMSDHLVLPHNHTFLMNSGEVAEEVLCFLRNGSFKHQRRD